MIITTSTVFARVESEARSLVLLAIFTSKTSGAGASVIYSSICAMSTVFAWVEREAWSLILLAIFPAKPAGQEQV